MSDRVNYLIVALEEIVREDDVQNLIGAIQQMRNVAKVAPEMENPGDWVALSRARNQLAGKIDRALYEEST